MSAHLQKGDFRKILLMKNAQVVKILRISESQLFKNSDTLEWQDDNQELKIQNRFHEVIGIRHLSKDVLVYCIEDESENKLFDHYFQKSGPGEVMTEILKLLIGLQYLAPLSTAVPLSTWQHKTRHFPQPIARLSTFNSLQIKPPALNFG